MNPRIERDLSIINTRGTRPASTGLIRVRVRYCECDPMGVVHHAAYLPWLEMARTEMLRGAGVSYAELERAGVFLVVVKLEARYKRPARYDDELDIRTRVIAAGRVKLEHEYEVIRVNPDGTTGETCFTGATTIACVDGKGHVRELPEWLTGTP